MGMLDNWQTPAKYFAPHFEVYLVDQRNHGRSPQSEEFNYQVLADDLFEFIYTHHLHDVNIIGHSMGGKTAMKFAQNNPQLVDKLIVAGRGVRSRGLVPPPQPSSGCQMRRRSAGAVEGDHTLCLCQSAEEL